MSDHMRQEDLRLMQFDELWGLHEEIAKLLAERILVEKRRLEKRLRQLNRGDLVEGKTLDKTESDERAPRRRYPRVLPKYSNPLLPSETWSGRGKTPRWMVAALRSGFKMEDLKIINDNLKK
jgi:DNA-binding protein H-NS